MGNGCNMTPAKCIDCGRLFPRGRMYAGRCAGNATTSGIRSRPQGPAERARTVSETQGATATADAGGARNRFG